MSGCLLANGKLSSCDSTKKIGGIQGDFWALNLKDASGVKLTYTEAANTISAIAVQSGSQAYACDGEKFQHNWTYSNSKPSANRYYTQAINIKVLLDTGADITWLDEMLNAEGLVLIIETNDQKFIVLGQNNGLSSIEGDMFDSGAEASSDVATTIPLSGEEIDAPYKYLDVGTGYDDTRNYIIGLETPAP